MREIPLGLPGADLVASGIEALQRGERTVEALLVCVGRTRMRMAGLETPPPPPLAQAPEIELYLAIAAEHPEDAHSRYNALIRRLVSFERALERLAVGGFTATAATARARHRDPGCLPAAGPGRERQRTAQRRGGRGT